MLSKLNLVSRLGAGWSSPQHHDRGGESVSQSSPLFPFKLKKKLLESLFMTANGLSYLDHAQCAFCLLEIRLLAVIRSYQKNKLFDIFLVAFKKKFQGNPTLARGTLTCSM